jgi:threonyl-tRNA synthetase
VEYAREVAAELHEAGIRAEVDDRAEKVGKKIREGELKKIPYMLVVGDQEASERTVAVRKHREGDLGTEPLSDFAGSLSAAILARE